MPADIAATDPISVVYSVEPDGLTFGGDGATVHFHFDETPSSLIADDRFGAGFPVSRGREGGPLEWQDDAETLHHLGGVEVAARLAHLSYQWASRRDEFREEYYLGVVYDATHRRLVGDDWTPRTDAQATTELESIMFERSTREADAVRVRGARSDATQTAWLSSVVEGIFFGPSGVRMSRVTFLEGASFAADRPHLAPAEPRFFCREVGTGVMVSSVTMRATRERARDVTLHVADPEVTECVEPAGPQIRILDTIPAVREDTAITTSTPPRAEVRVETRSEGTRTVNLAASPWYAIVEPRGMPTPMGPATITATNAAGATMTATRDDATGEYTALVDDPTLWDPSVSTQVTFGAATPRDVAPVPSFGAAFGAVNGLDTAMTLESDLRFAIRIGGELPCGPETLVDPEIFRSIADDFPLDGPLREGLQLLADHCGQAIETLTGRPFTVEISRRRSVLSFMPELEAGVDVGRAITIDGPSLLSDCTGRFSMFCTDRCIDPLLDPTNCGGCGRVGVEVCNDDVDNDCDSTRDEGCPTGIDWFGGGDSDVSSMIGDTTSSSSGNLGHGCTYFTPFTGLCGTTNTDGTVRGLSTICGAVSLVPTGLDAFEVRVTESHPGGIACEMAAFTPSGGTLVAARCPPNMIADGVQGVAPSSGNLGQVSVTCSQWDVVRDPALGWVIRRVATGSSPTVGSGPGMPFPSYMVRDHASLGTPGALRQLRGRYGPGASGMPAGVLWFSVAGSPPMLHIP